MILVFSLDDSEYDQLGNNVLFYLIRVCLSIIHPNNQIKLGLLI